MVKHCHQVCDDESKRLRTWAMTAAAMFTRFGRTLTQALRPPVKRPCIWTVKAVDKVTQRRADRILAVATRADEIVEETFGPAPRMVTPEQSNAAWAKAEAEVPDQSVER